jgi:hypothetical protein
MPDEPDIFRQKAEQARSKMEALQSLAGARPSLVVEAAIELTAQLAGDVGLAEGIAEFIESWSDCQRRKHGEGAAAEGG